MIPKEWCDYTWQLRPLYVLACFIISPVMVVALVLLARLDVDWPAWVQAVGSVIGIGIAIAVPAWQKSVAAAVASEAEFSSRKTSYHAFWVLVDECKAVMEELNTFLWYHAPMPARGTFARRQIVGKLRAYSHEMSQVPVEAFGFDVVPAVLRLKSEATFLQCVADEIEGGYDLGAIRAGIYDRAQNLDDIDKQISDLNDWLHDMHGKS